ncbi:MAG: SDR family NAD(P)-dependent oxidoreductase [Desulfobacterales bacterium]
MNSQPVVIVTGASKGIGAWIARWLNKGGANIILVARTSKDLQKTGESLDINKGNFLSIPADVSDPQACFRVIENTLKKFDRIDALVNNAGILEPVSRIADCKPDQFRQNISVNLLGPFYMVHEAISALRKSKGRVINISSGAAIKPIAAWSAYCTAKAGLTHFTRVLAEDEPMITSVSVRPGVVDTDMQTLIRQKGPAVMPDELSRYFISLKDDGKLEPPWVPARVIAWLALQAPPELSGEFIEYDDQRISKPAIDFFGKVPPA